MRFSSLSFILLAGIWVTRPAFAQGEAPTTRTEAPVTIAAPDASPPHLIQRGKVRASWPTGLDSGFYSTAQPAIANFAGDGHLSVVLPGVLQGKPFIAAWDSEGKMRKGFPVPVKWKGLDDVDRLGLPSIADLESNGRDEVLVSGVENEGGGPYHGGNRFVFVVDGNGQEWPIQIDAPIDPSTGVTPVADVDDDGVLDIVAGQTLTSVLGITHPIKNWPVARIPHGYSPAIGDAKGDGQMEIYQPEFERYWNIWPNPPVANALSGLDNTGQPLPGWPQHINGIVFNPVIGDVAGDDKAEVCVANGPMIHLWTWDGKPLPATHAEGDYTSVFKEITPVPGQPPRYYTCVTLADLDGDGKAEILAMDSTGTLYAWHGDGSGVRSKDGFFASAQGSEAHNQRFVDLVASPGEPVVADLGDDGDPDIFVGNWWFTLHKDGTLDATRMGDENGYAPSIVDLDGNGKAEILFQTDKNIVIYDTGKSFPKKGAQWPTARGNFQRTGMWVAPAKR